MERAASVTTPALVLTGGASFPWMAETGQALADALPNGQHSVLEGQQHNVAPDVLAGALTQFFQG